MSDTELDKEFDMLRQYLAVIVQLLPYCTPVHYNRLCKYILPSFTDFKRWIGTAYDMTAPHYKQAYYIDHPNIIVPHYTQGMATPDGIGYRYCNYFMGCKYFTDGNVQGNFVIIPERINESLKQI